MASNLSWRVFIKGARQYESDVLRAVPAGIKLKKSLTTISTQLQDQKIGERENLIEWLNCYVPIAMSNGDGGRKMSKISAADWSADPASRDSEKRLLV